MTPEIIDVNISFGHKMTFFLAMIGIADEQTWRQKTFGLKESEKPAKEYAANVSLLAELSAKMPEGLFDPRPKVLASDDETKYFEDFKTPREMVEAFFAEKTVRKERIAYYAVRGYFVRLAPDDFF